MISERVSRPAFFGVAALLFIASTAATILWCLPMSGMGGIPMPGGWTLSMAWMPMCGQTWSGAAATFLGMWLVMMAAMMLPVLTPALWRYRQAVGGADGIRRTMLTGLVGAGYFFIWSLFGLAIFPLGAGLAETLMRYPALAQAMPVATGLIVLIAGMSQFTAWKARQLVCCRQAAGAAVSGIAAWRHGLRLGARCVRCCAGPTAVLLVLGVMDLHAMAVVATAIIAERLVPDGERIARASGAIAIVAGLILVARALGLA